MCKCKKCRGEIHTSAPESVPYLVHETAMARNKRIIKRLIVALIISVVMIFATNIAWLSFMS